MSVHPLNSTFTSILSVVSGPELIYTWESESGVAQLFRDRNRLFCQTEKLSSAWGDYRPSPTGDCDYARSPTPTGAASAIISHIQTCRSLGLSSIYEKRSTERPWGMPEIPGPIANENGSFSATKKNIDLPIYPKISIEAQISELIGKRAIIKKDGGLDFQPYPTPKCEWEWNGKRVHLQQREESWVWQIFDRAACKTTELPFFQGRLNKLHGVYQEIVCKELGYAARDESNEYWMYYDAGSGKKVQTSLIPPGILSENNLGFLKCFIVKNITKREPWRPPRIYLQPPPLISPIDNSSLLDTITWKVSIIVQNLSNGHVSSPMLLMETVEDLRINMFVASFGIQTTQQSDPPPGIVSFAERTASELSCRVIEGKYVDKDKIIEMMQAIFTEIKNQNSGETPFFYNTKGTSDVFQVPPYITTPRGLRPVLDTQLWVAKKYKIATGSLPLRMSYASPFAKSYFDPHGSEVITNKTWAVTLINNDPDHVCGHAALIIETVGKAGYLMYKAHLRPNGPKTNLFIPGTVFFHPPIKNPGILRYVSKTQTWFLPKKNILKMMKEISDELKIQDDGNIAVYFDQRGKDALLVSQRKPSHIGSKEVHNCITWAVDKLAIAGIILEQGKLSTICTLPVEYTNTAGHKFVARIEASTPTRQPHLQRSIIGREVVIVHTSYKQNGRYPGTYLKVCVSQKNCNSIYADNIWYFREIGTILTEDGTYPLIEDRSPSFVEKTLSSTNDFFRYQVPSTMETVAREGPRATILFPKRLPLVGSLFPLFETFCSVISVAVHEFRK
jgi:hypothetical protein